MNDMKKIELHLHLEGAAPPAFIKGLSVEKRTDISGIFDENGQYRYRDFAEFLRVYEAVCSVLKTPADFARLLAEVLEARAEDGVAYVELFVSPEFCGGGDLAAWRDYLAAMTEVAQRFDAQGISSRAIVTPIRHLGPERAKKSAICAAETAGDWVTGLGLGGAEDAGKPLDFAWSFDCAREAGLGLTAHAGEWCGPAAIRETLALGVTRLGHGVRAVEDAALMRDLAEQGITLECCPGSNIALGVYPDWRSHPLARLADAGVRVTVSTDDPPFFQTTLGREYERIADVFRWSEAEFRQMNLWALEAAFCNEATKTRLLKELT